MTTPIYNPNVPTAPGDTFAESQPDLLNNFMALANIFAVNHVPLDASFANGNHTYMEMFEQENDPQTGTSQIAAYAKQVNGQATQVFLRSLGNSVPYQLTAYQIYPTMLANTYFTLLPGNIMMYFGTIPAKLPSSFDLFPKICDKIISIVVNASGGLSPSNGYNPWVTITAPSEDNLIGQINLFQAAATSTLPTAFNYIVLGNIKVPT